jgi:hypothetical protein
MRFILAVACIILGFAVAIFKWDFVFASLLWFLAAIAINTLAPYARPVFPRRGVSQ